MAVNEVNGPFSDVEISADKRRIKVFGIGSMWPL